MINYYLLIKPGIILGNLITFTAGFLLASHAGFDIRTFVEAFLGLGLLIASGCVFNNYIDRNLDKRMSRTKRRPLVEGRIKGSYALVFATLLGLLGNFFLWKYTNDTTVVVANIGFFVYVLLYSFLKEHTTYCTLIGSISGAVPPVVGYCAVSNHFDGAAALLFLFMVFWQMPHFFAIGLWHLKDYTQANIPIVPVAHGSYRAKVHMLLYIVGLIPIITLFTLMGYTGTLFLVSTTALALFWLVLAFKGFSVKSDARWGRQMFRYSLVMINAVCFLVAIEILI